jgi:hypothetical protein
VPQLEAWQKVFVNNDEFLMDIHGKVGCVICHGGNSDVQEKEIAHQDMVADPSVVHCDTCHQDISAMNEMSLHNTLSGFTSALEARGGDLSPGSPLDEAMHNHCSACHTTCGQCHVSRPDELGGGLVAEHEFLKTPSMQNNCAACHGSRIGDEYLGNNAGIPGDVHWLQAGMTCSKCHGEELHGTGELADDRYHTASAQCEDCHQEVWTDTADNPQHEQHLGDLSCNVCHSTSYKNCYSCHVAVNSNEIPYYKTAPSEMEFKIGLNPLRSRENPFKYVVLRHPPTNADIFDYYGENLLPDFDKLPTWKYATPHNIQLNTPQNESCNSCHGNESLFLTEDDLLRDEINANQNVIVPQIPESIP